MPLMHGLLNLVMLAVTIWCYWRILGRAGISGWWAYLMLLSLAVVFLDSFIRGPAIVSLLAPYIVPAILIWVFAFKHWPSFEADQNADDNRRFAQQGRDQRDDMPSQDPHRTVNPSFMNLGGPESARRRKGKS